MADPSPTQSPSKTLLLLTLLGLTGCALLATLHPLEAYDPERSLEQTGRHLQVNLEITTSRAQDGWARGAALPLLEDGSVHPKKIAWVWFRPSENPPQPGDRVSGRALLSQDGTRQSLLFDGPRAAHVTLGPQPIPVHWQTLLDYPQPLAERLLLINGEIDGNRLRAPDGSGSCPVAGTIPLDASGSKWLVRLQRDDEQPGWSCRLEGGG